MSLLASFWLSFMSDYMLHCWFLVPESWKCADADVIYCSILYQATVLKQLGFFFWCFFFVCFFFLAVFRRGLDDQICFPFLESFITSQKVILKQSDKINNKILENRQCINKTNPVDCLQMLSLNKQQNMGWGGQEKHIIDIAKK